MATTIRCKITFVHKTTGELRHHTVKGMRFSDEAVDTARERFPVSEWDLYEAREWAPRLDNMRTSRDPDALGAAVSTWAATEDGDHEADAAFEAVLLEQGVINPDEVVETLDDAEHTRPAVFVALAGGECFCAHEDGTIEPI